MHERKYNLPLVPPWRYPDSITIQVKLMMGAKKEKKQLKKGKK